MSTTFWLNSHYSPGIPQTECMGDNLTTEIDIVETVGGAEAWPAFKSEMGTNSHFHHWNCDGGYDKVYSKGAQTPLSSPCAEEFHTYGAWWKNANYITPYADDLEGETIQFRTDVLDEPFSNPLTMHMLTETYDWERPPTAAELANDANNTSYYDWVRTYKLLPAHEELTVPEFSLVVNRDFEAGFLKGWAGWGGNPREIVNNNQYQGDYAGHIIGAGAFEQAVGLKKNTNYVLSCWAKTTSGSVSFGIKEDGSSFSHSKSVSAEDYTQYTIEFNSGHVIKGKIFFYAADQKTEAYVDDFKLIEVDYVPLPKDEPVVLYQENISLGLDGAIVPVSDTINIPYIYQANIDRKLTIKILDPTNILLADTTIKAYAGYANYQVPVILNQHAAIGQGYKIEANLVHADSTILSSDTITFDFISNQKYQLTVNSGTGSGTYHQGSAVEVAAIPQPGYTFLSWSGDIEFLNDANSAQTTVTIPNSAVTITAEFEELPCNSTEQKIEAEDYQSMFGVQTESCSEGGMNVGWIESGDWMEYCIEVPTDSVYFVDLRVASSPGGGQLEIQIDDNDEATIQIEATGGWQKWITKTSDEIIMNEGKHTLRIFAVSGGVNVNWVKVKSSLSSSAYHQTANTHKLITVYPMPIGKSNFRVQLNNFNNKTANITILDAQGCLHYKQVVKTNSVIIDSGIFPSSGIYFVKVAIADRTEVQKIVVSK